MDYDPKLVDRVLNNRDNMSVVSDLSDAYLDGRELDHPLAADIHLAIVEASTPYGDLGHMSKIQATAFLPDDGSLGDASIDNAGLFPDAPEAIVDIEDSKFNGHTQNIPKYQSQSMKHPITPQGVPRRKHGSKGNKVSKRSSGGSTVVDPGGMTQEKAVAVLLDDSLSDLLDDALFGEGSDEVHSPVGQVAAFHSSLTSFEPQVTPMAAKQRMPASFLSAGNLNRPKLSLGLKGRRKGAQRPILEDISDVGPYGDVGGMMSYGDRGGMSEGKAASLLPDHSTSLLDAGFFLVDSPEQRPSVVSLGDSLLLSPLRHLEPPPTPQEERRKQGSLSDDTYTPGSKKPKAVKSSKGRKGSKSIAYGDLGGMSQTKVTSFNPDHSVAVLGDLADNFGDPAFFVLDCPEPLPFETPVKKSKSKSQQGYSSQPKATLIHPDQSVSELCDPTETPGAKIEPKSGATSLHSLELPMLLSPQGAPPRHRRVGSKQSPSISKLSVGDRRGKDGNSNSNHSIGKRNETEIVDVLEGGLPAETGTYGDLGGILEEQATAFLPDHSISHLGDPTLFLVGGSTSSSFAGNMSRTTDQSDSVDNITMDMGTYGDLGGLTEVRAASFLPCDSSMDSPGLFPEEMDQPLSIQSLQPPMTPQTARLEAGKKSGKKKSKGRKGHKVANAADVADAHLDSSFPNIIHGVGNMKHGSVDDIIMDMGTYGDLRGISEKQAASFLPDDNKGLDTAGLFLGGAVEVDGNAVGASDGAMDAAFGVEDNQPSSSLEFMQNLDSTHSDLIPPGSPVHVKSVSPYSESQSSADVSKLTFSRGLFNPHVDCTDALPMPKKPPGRPIKSNEEPNSPTKGKSSGFFNLITKKLGNSN